MPDQHIFDEYPNIKFPESNLSKLDNLKPGQQINISAWTPEELQAAKDQGWILTPQGHQKRGERMHEVSRKKENFLKRLLKK